MLRSRGLHLWKFPQISLYMYSLKATILLWKVSLEMSGRKGSEFCLICEPTQPNIGAIEEQEWRNPQDAMDRKVKPVQTATCSISGAHDYGLAMTSATKPVVRASY